MYGVAFKNQKKRRNAFLIFGLRSICSGCDASISAMPATSLGYIAAYARPKIPPIECPAKTKGRGNFAAFNNRCRSFAIDRASFGSGDGSLQPSPARSYDKTFVALE